MIDTPHEEDSTSIGNMPEWRPEAEIIKDLEKLSSSSGFMYALAYLIFRDNSITYESELTHKDLESTKSRDRTIRSEISLLLGLMVKQPLVFDVPSYENVQVIVYNIEKLLEELHLSINSFMFRELGKLDMSNSLASEATLSHALAFREPIFYAGEAVYHFQYRDLAAKKYAYDEDWLLKNAGFTFKDVKDFIQAIDQIRISKFHHSFKQTTEQDRVETLLAAFKFNIAEVSKYSGLSEAVVQSIVARFSLANVPCNKNFNEVADFNETDAFPLIPVSDGEFILFHSLTLAQSAYESPFFWLNGDPSYVDQAKKNRGKFAEDFSADRLKSVFGSDKVFTNIEIWGPTGKTVAEIDVLVVFADRAIILQAKSKKLTLNARKGKGDAIHSDFKMAVQDAYDQGFKCAELLADKSNVLKDSAGKILNIKRNLAETFIFCVVSEYYPALAHQADRFLQIREHDTIRPPYVMDIFFLDVLCEMLDTPLHFFNFIHRRVGYHKRLQIENEMTTLSVHLKHNLWIDGRNDWAYFDDDFSVYLDVAMLSRREGLPGKRIPDGILTRHGTTTFGKIIELLSRFEADRALELGYYLLELNERSVKDFSAMCDHILSKTRDDGQTSDFAIGHDQGGVTVHARWTWNDEALQKLYALASTRKYTCKADRWFALALTPNGNLIHTAMGFNSKWEYSEEMEKISKMLPNNRVEIKKALEQLKPKSNSKIGRNDPCPCNSGLKYKKCCLR